MGRDLMKFINSIAKFLTLVTLGISIFMIYCGVTRGMPIIIFVSLIMFIISATFCYQDIKELI